MKKENLEKDLFRQKFLPVEREFEKEASAPKIGGNLFRSPLKGVDYLNNKLRRRILEMIGMSAEEDAPSANYSNDQPFSHKWRPLIDYLRKNRLIEKIVLEMPFNDGIKFFFYHVINSFDQDITDGTPPLYESYGRGASEDADEAFSKAIGEFLERLLLIIYRKKELLKASINDLEGKRINFLNLAHLAGFSEEQKKENPEFHYDKNSIFYWIEGINFTARKKIFLPAQLVFWNYRRHHEDYIEPTLREPNTNGAGGHFTLNKAILSGVYELIQRDSFFIHWYNNYSPPSINISGVKDEGFRRLLRMAERYRFRVKFLDTTTDIKIPSCICLLMEGEEKEYKFSLGGGCNLSPEEALKRSFIEALSLYQWLREQPEDFELAENYRPFSDRNINQIKRLTLWRNPKILSYVDFLLKGETESLADFSRHSRSFESDEQELSYASSILGDLGDGYEINYYQAKHEILEDLGYFSVKVVVPKLIPLYLNEIYAPLGGERIYSVPKKLDWKTSGILNKLPHPFP